MKADDNKVRNINDSNINNRHLGFIWNEYTSAREVSDVEWDETDVLLESAATHTENTVGSRKYTIPKRDSVLL